MSSGQSSLSERQAGLGIDAFFRASSDDCKEFYDVVPVYPKYVLKPGETAIYGLFDPRNDGMPILRYIGLTKNFKVRYRAHLDQISAKSHKNHWIRSVLNDGWLPTMVEINTVHDRDAAEAEIKAIRCWSQSNEEMSWPVLTNSTTGGEGVRGHIFTYEQRQSISRAATGTRSVDPEGKRYRPVTKKPKHTNTSRQRIVEANKGEANHQAKLTWEIVREIRRRLSEGEIAVDLSSEYGIGTTQMSRIRRNLSWKETTIEGES